MFLKNKRNKKRNKIFIFSFFIIVFFAIPFLTFSATSGTNNFESVKFTPQIEFPLTGITGEVDLSEQPDSDGVIKSSLLTTYIQAIYKYGISIAGILAAVMIMGAGIIWLTSGGDSGKVSKAKNLIIGSIVGMFLLFGSYLLLNTVNPNLIELKPLEVSVIEDIYESIICCHPGYGEIIVSIIYNENIPYVVGGSKDGQMFAGCSIEYPGSKQCEKCDREPVSTTSPTPGVTSITYRYFCSKEVAADKKIETIANVDTVTCCHPDNYETKIAVTEKNGNLFYANGAKSGQLFTGCDKNTEGIQCAEGSLCTYDYYHTKKSFCNNDTFCCTCFKHPLFKSRTNYYCTNVSTRDECEEFCKEKGLDDGHGDGYYRDDPFPASLYSCSQPNGCVYNY